MFQFFTAMKIGLQSIKLALIGVAISCSACASNPQQGESIASAIDAENHKSTQYNLDEHEHVQNSRKEMVAEMAAEREKYAEAIEQLNEQVKNSRKEIAAARKKYAASIEQIRKLMDLNGIQSEEWDTARKKFDEIIEPLNEQFNTQIQNARNEILALREKLKKYDDAIEQLNREENGNHSSVQKRPMGTRLDK